MKRAARSTVEDLSFASGLRATRPRQQRRIKSWNTDHSVRSLPDWKAIDRLDKIFGSDNGFLAGTGLAVRHFSVTAVTCANNGRQALHPTLLRKGGEINPPGGAVDYAASRSLYGPPVITQSDPTLLS